ncbi:hypothetical protein L9F63_002113, partial [Diploptera punctata]
DNTSTALQKHKRLNVIVVVLREEAIIEERPKRPRRSQHQNGGMKMDLNIAQNMAV